MSAGTGRWKSVLLLAVIAVGLLCCGWKWWEVRRYRRAMAVIEEEIESGRNGLAARNLSALLAWEPDSDEAPYTKLKGRNPEVEDLAGVGRGWDGRCGLGRAPRS